MGTHLCWVLGALCTWGLRTRAGAASSGVSWRTPWWGWRHCCWWRRPRRFFADSPGAPRHPQWPPLPPSSSTDWLTPNETKRLRRAPLFLPPRLYYIVCFSRRALWPRRRWSRRLCFVFVRRALFSRSLARRPTCEWTFRTLCHWSVATIPIWNELPPMPAMDPRIKRSETEQYVNRKREIVSHNNRA